MQEIRIPIDAKRISNDRYWQFGIGSCHLAMSQRADYLEQLDEAVKELGFKRVRSHGVFHESMYLYQNAAEFIPLPGLKKYVTRSFFEIAKVYDNLLERGVRPIVELGLMPKQLASGKRTVFKYNMNITPPKKMKEWSELVRDFASFLIERYGKEEVESWLFEVWNEPDFVGIFWSGGKKKYMELYAATVRALKSVDENLKVGGPVTTCGTWITDMKEYCTKNNLPLDFLSTHLYPGDDVDTLNMAKSMVGRYLKVFKNRNKKLNSYQGINALMYSEESRKRTDRTYVSNKIRKIESEAADTPWYLTEWNANAICTAPEHDTKAAAAYSVKTVMDAQGHIDGCCYWSLSDIFEELNLFPEPFSGSFGLMTVYGVKKPNFYAFKFMNELGDKRIDMPLACGDAEAAAFESENEMQILLYRQSFVWEGEGENITLEIALDRPVKGVTVQKIDDDNANPIRVWQDIGSPSIPTKAEVRRINELAAPKSEALKYDATDTGIRISAALCPNDVHFIKISF